MGFTVIAPVGDNLKALFVGIKDFPTEKFILITPKHNVKAAKSVAEKLRDFTIKSEIIEIEDDVMGEMFKVFSRLCALYPENQLIVNVATGDRMSTCAALSAAFANGMKAFGVMGDKTMLLPIMKLSYYNEISENKMKVLKKLDVDSYVSIKELNKRLGMSVSLLSYHINGNYKHKGLKELRLVETKEEKKNLFVKLSKMGHLLISGYINNQKKVQ